MKHSFKFIATAQDVVGSLAEQRAPIMLRVESKAGHGAGTPLSKQIVTSAEALTFAAVNIGAKFE